MSSPKTLPLKSLPEPDLANQSSEGKTAFRAWILFAAAIAFALRLVAFREPLWLDELHTGWVVDGPLEGVYSKATIGNQGPLFFWITWLSSAVFGLNEFALRAPSMVAGLLLIPVGGWLVWKWTRSPAAAATTAFLLALNGTHIFYASEARPYALLQLMAVIQTGIFWDWLQGVRQESNDSWSGWKRVILVLLSVAMIYTHFTAALILFAQLVFGLGVVLADRFSEGKQRSHLIVAALPIIATFLLLSAPAFSGPVSLIVERRQNWEAVSSLSALWQGMMSNLFATAFVPVVPVGIFFIYKLMKQDRKRNPHEHSPSLPQAMLLVSCVSIPLIIALICHWSGLASFALPRYFVCSFAIAGLLAGRIIGMIPLPRIQWLALASLVGLHLSTSPFFEHAISQQQLPMLRREQWSEPIQQINQSPDKEVPVFLLANVLEDVSAHEATDRTLVEYLKFPVRGIYKIENPDRIIPLPTLAPGPFREQEFDLVRKHGRCWLLVRATGLYPSILATKLEASLDVDSLKRFSSPDSDVHLFEIVVGK